MSDCQRAESLASPALPLRHGFFTRRGGVSSGDYASLNCSLSGGDDLALVSENRARVAQALGADPARLVGLKQVHGSAVITVDHAWPQGSGPEADGMVTRTPGLALGIITADCAPVLFADPASGVAGAAHAGWRGALDGILEATIAAMLALGAVRGQIVAAIGPCITQDSYEVGADLHSAVLAQDSAAARFFAAGRRDGHFQFDLPGYCAARLRAAGLALVDGLGLDTLTDPERFFSHRRRTLAGGGKIGHQISVVTL